MERFVGWGLKVLRGEIKPWVWRLAFVIALVSFGSQIYSLSRYGSGLIDRARNSVIEVVNKSLPDNFEFAIKNGVVKSNQTEPFYVLISENQINELMTFFGSQPEVKKQTVTQMRLLTIDTNARVEDFTRYQTTYLVTRDSLVYVKDGDINVTQLSNISEMVITKKMLVDKINEYTTGKYKTGASVVIWSLPAILLLFGTVLQVLAWLGQAFLGWLIGKIIGAKVRFGRILLLTVYLTGAVDLATTALYYIKPMGIYLNLFVNLWALVVLVMSYYLLNLYKTRYGAESE